MTPLLMDRQPLLKKIKTPPTLKKNLNFYCQRTSGTFGFAATHEANAMAKPKEPLFPTLYLLRSETFITLQVK